MLLALCVSCTVRLSPDDSALPTGLTATQLPNGTVTVNPNVAVLAPLASPTVETATPGWLTPPTLAPTPSDTAPPTILFATPKPGQVQGVRGTVSLSGGPAPENGGIPTPYVSCCVAIVAREPGTQHVVAQTQSGTQGIYELQLLPSRYDICTAAGYGTDYCINNVIVTAGNFLSLDFNVAMP